MAANARATADGGAASDPPTTDQDRVAADAAAKAAEAKAAEDAAAKAAAEAAAAAKAAKAAEAEKPSAPSSLSPALADALGDAKGDDVQVDVVAASVGSRPSSTGTGGDDDPFVQARAAAEKHAARTVNLDNLEG